MVLRVIYRIQYNVLDLTIVVVAVEKLISVFHRVRCSAFYNMSYDLCNAQLLDLNIMLPHMRTTQLCLNLVIVMKKLEYVLKCIQD